MVTAIRLACAAAAFALSGCVTAQCVKEMKDEPIYAKVPIIGGCAVADVAVSAGAVVILGVESVADVVSPDNGGMERERTSLDGRWEPPEEEEVVDDPMRSVLWDLAQAEYAYQRRTGDAPTPGVLVGRDEILFFNDTENDIRFVLTSPRMATRTFHIKSSKATVVRVQPDKNNVVTAKLATGDKVVERQLYQGELYYLFYDDRDRRYDIGQIQLAEAPESGRFRQPRRPVTAKTEESGSGFVGTPTLPEGTSFGSGGMLSRPMGGKPAAQGQ